MLVIKTSPPSLEGFEGAFYRFMGGRSSLGILNYWYEAIGRADEKDYRVVWRIKNQADFMDKNAEPICDWENPAEVYCITDEEVVEDYYKIIN